MWPFSEEDDTEIWRVPAGSPAPPEGSLIRKQASTTVWEVPVEWEYDAMYDCWMKRGRVNGFSGEAQSKDCTCDVMSNAPGNHAESCSRYRG